MIQKPEPMHNISASSLKIDDVIRVRPGEAFPADGIITHGTSTVNEASITGESLPVEKSVGVHVHAGTQNLTGMVVVKVAAVGKDSTLGKVREIDRNGGENPPTRYAND